MPYLTRENLYRQTTTPEQMNFIENFYNMFDSGGIHKKIVNVEPLLYNGAIAATEFLTYSANKLYLGYQNIFSGNQSAILTTCFIQLYDETNTNSSVLLNCGVVWDTTGAALRYLTNVFEVRNVYFSRMTIQGYAYLIFNGYRITLN
jgi:hypothetical protein